MLTKSPGTPGWPKGGLYIPASSGDYFLQNLVTRILSDKELRQSSGIPKTVVRFVTFVPFHPFWLQKVVFWALDEVYQLSHKKSSSQSFTVRANYCCLDQQWPQNHQQGSAIQSADASGVNWGLVTEVRWLMQLGVSKANSMREDKEDMTSGWRQNISPTSVIRGSQVTFLVQYLLKLRIAQRGIHHTSMNDLILSPLNTERVPCFILPVHQYRLFNIFPDDKGNLNLTPNPLQGARVSVQQDEGAMWYVSNSVIIFQEKNVSFVITVPVTHCPLLIHTISATLFGPIRRSVNRRCQVDTGQMMTRSSSRMLRTRKTKYSANMVTPKTRLILQRQAAMEAMTKRSIRKSNTMAQKRPLEVTVTGWPWWIRVYKSHGTGRLWTQRRDHLLWIRLDDSILVYHPLPQTYITKYKNWNREGAISRHHLTKTQHQIERKKDK